jgi:hypothetical protein
VPATSSGRPEQIILSQLLHKKAPDTHVCTSKEDLNSSGLQHNKEIIFSVISKADKCVCF